ncbi:hypothetical protein CALCODRAFT_466290 [Calocera cornea HHB12733]|uniref:CRAL-TRIO domain-containing protein n=1 Tax=Calocera cornea HHB12733 TaxID=1353952 RepID=A0A165HX49_9BASI|nr:hypothetical protein CALCODRAFT_466290 [Calocera cornea HHB12733]
MYDSKVNTVLSRFEVIEGPPTKLTWQFTETEWKALREMKDILPSIFTEAFPDNEKARFAPVTIWGVSVDPNFVDARASVVLMHFLRSKKLKIADAKQMLIDTLRWRAEFAPEKAAHEPYDEDVFGKAAQMFGKDKEGRPVQYNIMGRDVDMEKVFTDETKYLTWRIGLLERGCMLLDFENVDQLVQIYDFARNERQTPQVKALVAAAGKIFRSYYPQMGHQVFFVYMITPGLFKAIFWCLHPFFPTRKLTEVKLLGVGPQKVGSGLLPFIAASELPKPYGGTAEPKWATGPEWENTSCLRTPPAKTVDSEHVGPNYFTQDL